MVIGEEDGIRLDLAESIEVELAYERAEVIVLKELGNDV